MLKLGVVRFVKDQEVDLIHSDETVSKALVEHLRRTDDDLVLLEMICPDVLVPEVCLHGATEPCDFVVQVTFQNGELLKDQIDRWDLNAKSDHQPISRCGLPTRKKATRGLRPA